MGLYRDIGKNMETTRYYSVYVALYKNHRVYMGYTGIMGKKMEPTIF